MIINAGRHKIEIGRRTLLMGILNTTPDSFSDGGDFYASVDAYEQIDRMIAEGADIIDIGGESSRPGSEPVDAQQEILRIKPALDYLRENYPHIPVSVDTWKHEVAQAALSAGASIINDIYGLLADPQLAHVISRFNAAVVLMHNAVSYRTDQASVGAFANAWRMQVDQAEKYSRSNLFEAIHRQLEDSIIVARAAGISDSSIIIDPGLGFGVKSGENFGIIEGLASLKTFGFPILVAPSRKRFIGDVLELPACERDIGTAAVLAIAIRHGADIVRVHNVSICRQAALIADKFKSGFGSDLFSKGSVKSEDEHDRIIMKGMAFYGYIGCLPEEQRLGQRFVIDCTIGLKTNQASITDNLTDSVSYADIYSMINDIMTGSRFNLIERLAGYIAEKILSEFSGVACVEVCVSKPQAPVAGLFENMQVCVKRTAL